MMPGDLEVIRFVERYAAEHDGITPTIREIVLGAGCTGISGAVAAIDRLVNAGRLRREPHARRGLRIVPREVDLSTVPDGALLAELSRRAHLARAKP